MTRSLSIIVFSVGAHAIAAACPVSPANTPSTAAQKLATAKLNGLLKCDPAVPLNDKSPCNIFAAQGLEALYGVTDFKKSGGTFMSANEIADFVSQSDKWSVIGPVFDETNNLCAQAAANQAFPVIAVQKKTGHGHVALVIPGEPTKSGTWNMLAANSASFLLAENNKPINAYVSGPLSRAFGTSNAKEAKFYYRKP